MPEPKGPSKIWVRQVDDAVVQDATYDFGRNDRQYLDSQIRGAETHLTASLVNGIVASWFPGDPALVGGNQPGDVVCVSAATPGTVTTAVFAALATAGEPMGIVLEAAPQGAPVHTALSGEIPPAITGLPGGGNLLYAVVGSNGRVTTKASIATNDYVLGTCTANGYLTLRVQLPSVVTGTTTNVSGSGFWHESAGSLDPAASRGTAGQFAITKAGGGDTGWASISGDATGSTATPGQLTVTGLQGVAIAATAPTSGQVLGFNGSQYVPTNPTSGGGGGIGNVANWSVTPLFWDPANSTGLASDDFTNPLRGKDAAHPILTWNTGLVQGFWGTYSPSLTSTGVIVNQMSAQSGTADSFRLSPYNGKVTIVGPLTAAQQVGSGTLGGITAKNPNTRQLLAVTMTAGGIAVGQLVFNSTRNSYAYVNSNVSGNVWNMCQPQTTNGAEDNGWTTGDGYTIYQNPVAISLASGNPQDNAGITFQFLSHSIRSATLQNSCNFLLCQIASGLFLYGSGSALTGCDINADVNVDRFNIASLSISGGQYRGGGNGIFGQVNFSNDYIHSGSGQVLHTSGSATNVWVMVNTAWNVSGAVSFSGYVSGTGRIIVADAGNVGCPVGTAYYSGTAAATFLNSGGIFLRTNTNPIVAFADAVDRTVDPAQTHTNRALTTAALDLSVAAGGFNGCAMHPGGFAAFFANQPTTAPVAYITPVANGGTGIGTAGSNGQVLTIVSGAPAWANPSGGGGSSFYQTIQDLNGAALPQQPIFQFTGGGQSVANGSGKTVITIPLPFYQTVQDPSNNPLGQQPVIQFTGAGVSVANGSGKTIVTIPGGGGGGSFTAGGDLTGNNVAQQVQSVSGAAGAGGTVPLNIQKLQWAKGQASPTIEQAVADAGVAPQSSFWRPQFANSGATAGNGTSGSAVVDLGLPRANGTEARFSISRGGLFAAGIGPVPGAPSASALYLADGTGYAVRGDGNTTIVNAGTSGQLQVAGNGYLLWSQAEIAAASTNAGFFVGRPDPSAQHGVISIGEFGTVPAANSGPASGSGIFAWAGVGQLWVTGTDFSPAASKINYPLSPNYPKLFAQIASQNLLNSTGPGIIQVITYNPRYSTHLRIRFSGQCSNSGASNGIASFFINHAVGSLTGDSGSTRQATVLPAAFSNVHIVYDFFVALGVTFPIGSNVTINIVGQGSSNDPGNPMGFFGEYELEEVNGNP